jgi:hypothetical protein
MAHVKGSAIAARLKWVRTHHGEAAVDRVREAMRLSVDAERLRFGVAKSEWYPFELFVDLTETIDRVLGRGDGALISRVAGQSAEDDMRTIYKVFFRAMKPLFVVKKAAQVWRQHYDSTTIQAPWRSCVKSPARRSSRLETSRRHTPSTARRFAAFA